MALTKTIEEDKIEVVGPYKHVQVRTATVIKEDDKELSRSFNRKVVSCGYLTGNDNTFVNRDISGESPEVQGICNSVWNDTIRANWKESLIKNLPRVN